MNLDGLTATARSVIEDILCSSCKGTAKWYPQAWSFADTTVDAEPCEECTDHPGLDLDSIHHEDDPDCPYVLPAPGRPSKLVVVPLSEVTA